MTSQLFSYMHRFEMEVIGELRKDMGRTTPSAEICRRIIDIINGFVGKAQATPELVAYIRLALKLSPYAPEVPTLLDMHCKTLKAILEQRMPALCEIVRACGDKGLPVPLIVSCDKYRPAAVALQQVFRERYFSIPPIIVRGDLSLNEPQFDFPFLSVSVADIYEALPTKVFETFVLFQALGVRSGVIKFDDDLTLPPDFVPDLRKTTAMFSSADYMGVPVQNPFHDRIWHFGKCAEPTPAVYSKPIKSVWARGPLYFLSAYALEKMSQHYLRFPGCLEGEIYEDKAVGDVLYDNAVLLTKCVLEQTLGLDSKVQDRG
jgi:hypothetical protein